MIKTQYLNFVNDITLMYVYMYVQINEGPPWTREKETQKVHSVA